MQEMRVQLASFWAASSVGHLHCIMLTSTTITVCLCYSRSEWIIIWGRARQVLGAWWHPRAPGLANVAADGRPGRSRDGSTASFGGRRDCRADGRPDRGAERAVQPGRPSLCVERALAFTRSHRRTEGLPLIVRRAKAFREVCESIPVIIFDHELVVGTPGAMQRPGPLCPEISWKWIADELDTVQTRSRRPVLADRGAEGPADDRRSSPTGRASPWRRSSWRRLPDGERRLGVDSGILDSEIKWRSGVAEIEPEFEDIIFVKDSRASETRRRRASRGSNRSPRRHSKACISTSPSSKCARADRAGTRLRGEGVRDGQDEPSRARARAGGDRRRLPVGAREPAAQLPRSGPDRLVRADGLRARREWPGVQPRPLRPIHVSFLCAGRRAGPLRGSRRRSSSIACGSSCRNGCGCCPRMGRSITAATTRSRT